MWRGTTSEGSATMPSGKRGKSRSIVFIAFSLRTADRRGAERPRRSEAGALAHAGHTVGGDQLRPAVGRVDLLEEPRAAAGRRCNHEVHRTAPNPHDLV